jgi:MFS transporter, AAHS family, 4-hydroxybenzoate transporter
MIEVQPPVNILALINSSRISTLQILVVVLCAFVLFFDGLDSQVIGFLGPAIAKEWHLPPSSLSALFTSALVGLMIGLLMISPISDKIGRKWVIIVSVLLFGLFTLLGGTAGSLAALIAYRFVAGIGLGGALSNALALTAEYCPQQRRATLVILMFCGFSLGAIGGGFLAASLVPTLGWRAVFIVGGALPLVLMIVLLAGLPESPQFLVVAGAAPARIAKIMRRIAPNVPLDDETHFVTGDAEARGVPVVHLFRDSRGLGTVLIWIVFFMTLLILYFLQTWLPTILTGAGLSIMNAALITNLINGGGIIAGLAIGPLMDRFGSYPILAVLCAAGVVFLPMIGLALGSLGALTAVTLGAGLAVSGAVKAVNTLAVIFYPTPMRSTGSGWALGIGRFGSILAPLLGGWLLGRGWSPLNVFEISALPMFLAAIAVVVMGLRYGGKTTVVEALPAAVQQ